MAMPDLRLGWSVRSVSVRRTEALLAVRLNGGGSLEQPFVFTSQSPRRPPSQGRWRSTPPFDIQHVNVSDANEPGDGAQVQVLTKSFHRPA